jgi:hypothetical protein
MISGYGVGVGMHDIEEMVEKIRVVVFFDQWILYFCPTQGTRYLVLDEPRIYAPRVKDVIPRTSNIVLGSGVDIRKTY